MPSTLQNKSTTVNCVIKIKQSIHVTVKILDWILKNTLIAKRLGDHYTDRAELGKFGG